MYQSNSFEKFYLEIKKEILKNIEIFNIPNNLDIIEGKGFISSLESRLNDYSNFLEKKLNEIINRNVSFGKNQKDVLPNKVKFLNEGIIKTIENYLDGKPFIANKLFTETLSEIPYQDIQFESNIAKGELFYRARCDDNSLLEKNQLFHIPFEKRHLVSTNRYSIPGVPALYFGENTYTCWEEFDRPEFKKMIFSTFESTKELETIQILRIEDLLEKIETSAVPKKFKFTYILSFLNYFPLSLACSIKVKNKGSFKIEYIIPQMLLEYVIKNDKIDGIKFPSTKVNYKNLEKLKAYNYVFPIKLSKTTGFCPKLTQIFKLSEPTSLEVEELLNNPHYERTIIYSDKELEKQPEKLTIINNDKRSYYDTSFGKLDKILEKKTRKEL